MDLPRLVHRLLTIQKRLVFEVPHEISSNSAMQRWSAKLRESETPLVVKEETYYRYAIDDKLKSTPHLSRHRLPRYGMIRPREGKDFTYGGPVREPIDTLSLAQSISWATQVPIERIIISESHFKTKRFLALPFEKRLEILMNAYNGTDWLNKFTIRQRAIIDEIGPVSVKEWQPISRYQLRDWFMASPTQGRTLDRLCELGFIVPENGEFKSRTPNFVNNRNLALFMAKIYGIDSEEVLIEAKDDPTIQTAIDDFITTKLLPYMITRDMMPNSTYTFSQAAKLIGTECKDIKQAVERKSIRHTKYQGKGARIRGIDLAIYAIRRTRKYHYTVEEARDLFCTNELKAIGLGSAKEGRYPTQHVVAPFYHRFGDLVREKVDSCEVDQILTDEGLVPISLGGMVSYCIRYGIDQFDQNSKQHISDEINGQKLPTSGTITLNSLIITMKHGKINNIGISQKTPHVLGVSMNEEYESESSELLSA